MKPIDSQEMPPTTAANSTAVQQPIAQLRKKALTYRPGLDITRFLAALWVMASHAHAIEGGGHAVAVFFVLSGYLIGGQLLEAKVQSGTIELSTFYFKRITRIWLPYFLVLAGMILLFTARGQHSVPGFYERAFGAVTYTYNLVNDIKGDIHPIWVSFNQIWSLSIEEQFYLVVPLLIRWLPNRSVVPTGVFLLLVFLFYAPLYAGLVVGVLLASISTRLRIKDFRRHSSLIVVSAFVIAFVVLVAIGQTDISQSSWVTYLLSAVVIVLASLLWVPERFHRVLRYLGLMTYSYYLIHGLPVYFLGAAYRKFSGFPVVPVWMQIAFGLMALPLSYFFVRYIELPCLLLRNDALKSHSKWIDRSPWLAWGLSLAGVVGLIFMYASPISAE